MAKRRERNVGLEIQAANAELKMLGVRLKIEQRSGCKTLNLRGRLPSKDDSAILKTQRIRLDVGNSTAAIAYAKKEAMRLGVLLEQKRFSWDEVARASTADTCAQAIEKFKRDWLKTQSGTKEAKEQRFRVRFWNRGFSKLPQHRPITAAMLEATLNAGWEPDTAGRKIAAQNLARLAEFSGINDVILPAGKYGTGSVQRDIPADADIEKAIDAIAQHDFKDARIIAARDGWQWIAGVMAAYGLRNHEAFACSLNWEKIGDRDYLVCTVHAEADTNTGRTKTGSRKIMPLPNNWVERWDLDRVRKPKVKGNAGAKVARQFKRLDLGFTAYCLRHAWNIRCSMQTGIAPIIRYAMMGHSQQTNEIYQKHLRESQMLEGFVKGLE